MYELPIRMESLQIEEGEMEESVTDNSSLTEHCVVAVSDEVSSSQNGRVLRNRPPTPPAVNSKRRCKLLPKKFSVNCSEGVTDSVEDLASLYTSRGSSGRQSFKCLLETIYEEPLRHKNGSIISVGIKKIKRTITFPTTGVVSKAKQRTRKAKTKLLSTKWKLKKGGSKSVTLDSILAKLEMDNSEDLAGS